MIIILALYIVCCCLAAQALSQTIITGTFNLRYDNTKDSGDLWKNRAPVTAALIRFHEYDIVGTQEGLRNQLDDLQKSLPEYAWYGIGRDDGHAKGEHSAIFYKKEKFNVIDSGDFCLSEHPEKPGFGWDARNNRIKESSKLIIQKIKSIAGDQPVILTGDFNGNHQSEWYTFNSSITATC